VAARVERTAARVRREAHEVVAVRGDLDTAPGGERQGVQAVMGGDQQPVGIGRVDGEAVNVGAGEEGREGLLGPDGDGEARGRCAERQKHGACREDRSSVQRSHSCLVGIAARLIGARRAGRA
jgi:hypothetical protein